MSHVSIPQSEQRKLHQRSGNRCAFPGCRELLTVAATSHDRMVVLGENAHIVAEKPDGPRGNSPLLSAARNCYENLILLCNNHHQRIDSQPDSFPVALLQEWKADHERWVEEQLSREPKADSPPDDAAYTRLGRSRYLEVATGESERRRRRRRFGAGLDDAQVKRSLGHRVGIPNDLAGLAAGQTCVLVGALGSGKSETAEEWHQAALVAASADSVNPVPVWVAAGSLHKSIEDFLVGEVGRKTLSHCGVDLVIDGLDEHTEDAARLLAESQLLVDRWPATRVLLTARSIDEALSVREVRTPLLDDAHAAWLMEAVVGSQIPRLSDQLAEAARRPLFALLIARHASSAEGATGIPELVDRVVDDVVEREGFDLYTELKHLAVETIRDAKPVDPVRFTTAATAARVRGSSLVTRTGRECAFSLATFEQWFAAKAVLEGDIDLDVELTSLETFDKWKYVLAIVLAAGDPACVDPVMNKLARWNPGAAAWIIRETHAGGLTRTNPDYDSSDWARIGVRLRIATEAWMAGLGPLALASFPGRITGSTDLDRITLAVGVDARSLRIAWLISNEFPEQPLSPVVPLSRISLVAADRTISMKTHDITTGPNWVWETMQDHLAADIGDNLAKIADVVLARHDSVVRDELNDMFRSKAQQIPKTTEDQTTSSLYPGPDIGPSIDAPWGSYREESMLARAYAVAAAAMRCYLELADHLAPNFGDTLGIRGLMPVEFYGDLHYSETRARDEDSWGPPEPGIAWTLKPIRSTGRRTDQDRTSIVNSVSLTLNDGDRDAALRHDFERLATWHKQRALERPAYEPFEAPFTAHFGGFAVLQDRPATSLALRWLWDDLKQLSWVKESTPPRFYK